MSGILYINSCTRTSLTIPHSLPQQLYKQYFLTMSSQAELAALIQEQSDIVTGNSVAVASCIYLEFATFPSLQTYNALGLLFARAYAISSHKKLVFVVLASLGTTAIVLFMIAISNENCISTSNIFALCKMLNPILKTKFMIHVAVKTLNNVFVILCDTAVFIAINENTLGLLQLQSGIPGMQRNTLSKMLIQQGIVTDKVLRRNDHPNGSITSHSLPFGSFHAVTERIHRAVVDEFGDLSFNESFGTEGSQEDIELQDIQSPSGVAEIDLQEFPWAGGDIGDEEAGPVASGSGILRK
ncbi:hypothetical protein K439DRAFT_1523618 [Ramaria rubella]|nr:hypothetical protein K439DRAFT_1523618 [Ramaria rubella]